MKRPLVFALIFGCLAAGCGKKTVQVSYDPPVLPAKPPTKVVPGPGQPGALRLPKDRPAPRMPKDFFMPPPPDLANLPPLPKDASKVPPPPLPPPPGGPPPLP